MKQKIIINPQELQAAVDDYIKNITEFIADHKAEKIFQGPIDHCAIKTWDSEHYEQYVVEYKPASDEVSYAKVNNRRLATLILKQPISCGQFGSTKYLEIMEPRPGITPPESGVEHIELYNPNFDDLKQDLQSVGITFDYQENTAHAALVIKINNFQELKFTNSNLGDIVQRQIKTGESIIIS